MNISRHSYLSPKVQIRPRGGNAGPGAVATDWLARDELISVWSGFIVNRAQLEEFPQGIQRHTVQIEEDLYLSSWTEDEPADYINHSCDPNAGLMGQLVLVALRDIAPGEEITFDYATSDGSSYDEFICECGSPNCRGRVTGDDWKRPELWERYAGHFMPYLQRRIEQYLTPPTPDRPPQDSAASKASARR